MGEKTPECKPRVLLTIKTVVAEQIHQIEEGKNITGLKFITINNLIQILYQSIANIPWLEYPDSVCKYHFD